MKDQLSERAIAIAAGHILQERFNAVASSESVLYAENDVLLRKEPDQQPVFVKYLVGRNPDLAKRMLNRRAFKMALRNMMCKTIL